MPELFAEDYVQPGPQAGMEVHSLEEYEEAIRMSHAAFSGLESTEDLSLATTPANSFAR